MPTSAGADFLSNLIKVNMILQGVLAVALVCVWVMSTKRMSRRFYSREKQFSPIDEGYWVVPGIGIWFMNSICCVMNAGGLLT